LLAIVNIPSSMPIFISLTESYTPAEKHRIALIAALTMITTLVAFTFLGTLILRLFGISIESFRIAGGILILLSALAMMNPPQRAPSAEQTAVNKMAIAIVPIGIPLLAGPGAISTIVVYAHLEPKSTIGHELVVTSVILLVAALTYLSLRVAPRIGGMLGPSGIEVFNRIMGLIVAAVAIEFIFGGILAYLSPLLK
jgi:multiple antibiotic resistance protein